MGEPTRAVWITRSPTTVRHARSLMEQLDAAGALDYAQLRIMVVDGAMQSRCRRAS